jgi:hypothetical protein
MDIIRPSDGLDAERAAAREKVVGAALDEGAALRADAAEWAALVPGSADRVNAIADAATEALAQCIEDLPPELQG